MTVAALQCQFLHLTSYKADVEFKLQKILNRRQYLSYQTMTLATAKTEAMLEDNESLMNQCEYQESIINQMDKIMEMDQKNIETQQKAAATELESVQKLLTDNVKREFKINA